MSRQRLVFLFALAGIAVVAGFLVKSHAQPADAKPRYQVTGKGNFVPMQAAPGYPSGATLYRADAGDPQVQAKTSAAVEKYQAAETDEARAAAEKELREAVAEHFELLVKEREVQIADMQERLAKLTKQLQKRRDAKHQIVDLRVQVLINEANGLGFYPDTASPGGDMFNDFIGGRGYGTGMGRSLLYPSTGARPAPTR